MLRAIIPALLLAICASAAMGQSAPQNKMDLSGEWRFAMDREDVGQNQGWFTKELAGVDKIKLPGILQAQGYGDDISVDTPWVAALPRDMKWFNLPQYAPYTKPGNVKMPYLSQPPKHYLGVAWYQRDVDVPAGWAGEHVHLTLERAHWGTTAWIDDKQIGTQNSIVAPHEFDAGTVASGRHVLTVRVDNRMTVVPGYRPDGHGVSDALGGAWNGMAGRLELTATSPVYIDDAQVFPNVEKKSATIKVHVGNISGNAGTGTVSVGGVSVPASWAEAGGEVQVEVPLPTAQTWDEFHPVLQHLTVVLKGDGASDSHEVSFGMREISHDGKKLLFNGREINLRFTHSGGDFPLTGYPAMDVAAWKKIIQTCKDYGLNGFRFHSWCPPEAAFEAADELGFYIQPEAGMWNNFNPAMVQMLDLETARMERAYGNHPSYIMLSPSNEPAGNYAGLLPPWAAKWVEADPRRLYCGGTGRTGQSPAFSFTTSVSRGPGGWFGKDYGAGGPGNVPTLGHEVGQWCVYPDFDVMKKFTGYLQPGNYEIWRDFAAQHGVLIQNKQLAWASGKFSEACYKQEIEANLRSPGLSGLVLLDLHDYLGQGGALIGMLDTFWESKGFVTADEFHRFCAPVVPLARMRNYVYRSNDPFEIPVELANYSQGPIAGAAPYWKIVDLSGKTAAEDKLATRDLPIGKSIPLGTITADLSKLAAPAEYRLVVGVNAATTSQKTIENDWNFWLYPAEVAADAPADVLITTDWNAALAKLNDGGKVFFTPPASMLDASCPPLATRPIFWNRVMNNTGAGGLSQVGFLGLLVDSKHPALAEFPTEGFCDWQWTDITNAVRAINLERVPYQLIPVVQAIDDWNRDFKLGVVFEANVGRGKLLVSAINLQPDARSSVARQLRHSLLAYAASDKFNPKIMLSSEQANALWPSTRPPGYKAPAMPTISTQPNANPGDVEEPTGNGPGPR
jgi:beta-galactosidase